ncbi:MAG: tRNA 2-thiouridine(34) synthase MnmA [Treponema sp.]|jgi:tRNA-specific 2-thiouridylase|nr:tRNA 2-thiouridine(34) synthase MnmA [Treponema sp.]
MGKKALIAMSGGVDSSVAAYLLKQQGFDCTGITMKLFTNEDIGAGEAQKCCSLEDAADARNVAYSMGIPFFVYNFTEDFKKQVINHFIESYQNGATPNPCIDCNRYIKFARLLDRAQQLEMDCIATGHYARTEYDAGSGRYLLKKATDETKDQSYVLYAMTQEQLSHTLFPLGALNKSAVRGIAREQGFINADKHDSQDICFVRDGSCYAEFIEHYTGKKYEEGDFVDMQGNVLGRHKGLIWYTIGQRKGLGLSLKRPLYVHSKNTENNTVTLCEDNILFSKSLDAADFNWIACEKLNSPIHVKTKIRYNQKEQWATVTQTSDDTVHIEFDEPQRAIAKGQAVVLYDGDVVVGGGTIL